MKTAEEWIKDHTHCPNGRNVITDKFTEEDLRAIQLDAFKAGMTKGAEHGYQQATDCANPESRSLGTMMVFSTAGMFKDSILKFRDSLTHLPT